jgi:hypothetical protein
MMDSDEEERRRNEIAMQLAQAELARGLNERAQWATGMDQFSRSVRGVEETMAMGDYDAEGRYRPFMPRRGVRP